MIPISDQCSRGSYILRVESRTGVHSRTARDIPPSLFDEISLRENSRIPEHLEDVFYSLLDVLCIFYGPAASRHRGSLGYDSAPPNQACATPSRNWEIRSGKFLDARLWLEIAGTEV